jgi:hypothetical protein
VAFLLQSLNRYHLDLAKDASSVAAAGASTAACLACYTGVLQGSRRPLLHAFADASTAPAVGCDPCLVTLDRYVGSTVIDQLIQHNGLTPPSITNWVADSDASNHTTLDADNLTPVRPPTSTDPSSIVVGNGSALPVTSVGDSAIPSPFYLNNVLVTHDII